MSLFSVVIPTYNRAQKLRMCLDALNKQTYPHVEVIVVDDGSTDETEQVAHSFSNVRYIRLPHGGGAGLFNIGWHAGRGEFVLFSDDDCVGPPTWLEALADGFRRHPEAVAVGSYAAPPDNLLTHNRFADYDNWLWQHYGGGQTEYVGGAETPTAGLVAYKRTALEEVGGMNEKLIVTGAHDHDLKQRLTARGYKFVYLPLKIDHFRDYSATAFHQQYLGRGRAIARYEAAQTGHPRGYARIGLRALKQVFLLVLHLATMRDKVLAWTIFEANSFNCAGQWQEQFKLRREVKS